jgi:hypothetical protein
MNDKETNRFAEWKNFRLTAAVMLVILVAGALFAWWTVVRADRERRDDLLQQTRLAAQAVNIDHVKSLTGTEADIENSDYRRLKQQLTAIRSANPLCRFVYLTGRKAEGTIFFIVDSEPVSSKNYSPPGQVYEDVSEDFRSAFDTKTAVVEGTLPDEWGVWVSGLVPITDPQTGAVVAVLGMDIDADDWKWNVAAKAALPVGLMLVLLISVAAVFAATRHIDTSPKPILRLLLPSLAVIMILLIVGAVLVNNFVLTRFLGRCLLYVSPKIPGV